MRFRGKIDLWFWFVFLAGDALITISFFDTGLGWIIGGLVTALIYNLCFVPFLIRNYVEVSEDKLTVVFGFSKDSMNLSDIVEVYRSRNPISSTAASLDRIVIKSRTKSVLCAVKEREEFFALLKEKNPGIAFGNLSKKGIRWEKISIVGSLVVVAIIGIMLFTGNISLEYKEDSFVIHASYWQDKEINYAEVESIELREEAIPGSRVAGWGSMRLLLGDFHNQEFEYYTRYTYANSDSGVILIVKGREYVISGKDVVETREIYEELRGRCNGN